MEFKDALKNQTLSREDTINITKNILKLIDIYLHKKLYIII